MGGFERIGARCFNAFQDACISLTSRAINKELARRSALRGQGAFRWFIQEEAAVAEALAKIIVPSDENTPGIDEIDVLGPPAIVILDNLVTTSPERQYVYSRGLLSFDIWAIEERGCKFAAMTTNDQIMLLRSAQQVYEEWTARVPSMVKVWRRLRSIARVRSGQFFAAQLYPQIRSDSFQAFYTSRVSWIWLEYDGPPMDEGYPRLEARR